MMVIIINARDKMSFNHADVEHKHNWIKCLIDQAVTFYGFTLTQHSCLIYQTLWTLIRFIWNLMELSRIPHSCHLKKGLHIGNSVTNKLLSTSPSKVFNKVRTNSDKIKESVNFPKPRNIQTISLAHRRTIVVGPAVILGDRGRLVLSWAWAKSTWGLI